MSLTTLEPINVTKSSLKFEPQYQVILWDDSIHELSEVISDLMSTFGHSFAIANKLVTDIHENVKGLVEVESRSEALAHKEELQAKHYTCDIEPINI